MTLPTRLEVALTQAQLAVLIGAVELIIGEAFKNAVECGFSWYRRWALDKKGRFRVSSRQFVNYRHKSFIYSILLAFVAVVISLELSIEETPVRTKTSKQSLCFGPNRLNRYLGKGGPRKAELNDERVDPYIIRAGCGEKLFTNVLQGPTAIDRGYPTCLPPFGEDENITFKATLQGCGVGYVAKSLDGDYHCDLLPVEELNRTESKIAGINFLAIHAKSKKSSSAFFVTEGNRESRYISNTEIPSAFYKRDLPVNQTETLVCSSNSLECYNRVRPKLVPLEKTRHFYPINDKIVLIKALSGLNSSAVCVLSSGNLTLFWSYLKHTIPGVDRNGREGPVLTDLTLTGRGRCAENLAPMSARLYLDSMEYLRLNMTHKSRSDSDTSTLDRTDPVVLLKVAAVVNGLKVTNTEATPCDMWVAAKGSVMATRKFIAAFLFSLVLIGATLFALVFGAYSEKKCPVRVDPLDPLWPVQHLLHGGPERLSSDRRIHSLANGGNVMGNRSGRPGPQPANDDDPPPLTPTTQPRFGLGIGPDSSASTRTPGSRGIGLQSPISFSPVDNANGSRSPALGCLSRRVNFRSPVVRVAGASGDDFWISIEEDPEENVGRFMPHASANFESLKNYPRQIR